MPPRTRRSAATSSSRALSRPAINRWAPCSAHFRAAASAMAERAPRMMILLIDLLGAAIVMALPSSKNPMQTQDRHGEQSVPDLDSRQATCPSGFFRLWRRKDGHLRRERSHPDAKKASELAHRNFENRVRGLLPPSEKTKAPATASYRMSSGHLRMRPDRCA